MKCGIDATSSRSIGTAGPVGHFRVIVDVSRAFGEAPSTLAGRMIGLFGPKEHPRSVVTTGTTQLAGGVGNCRSLSPMIVEFGLSEPTTLARADLTTGLSVFFQPVWSSMTSSLVIIRP